MAENGFFGNLTNSMQSPLFLGGAGILMGGGFQGMNQGIQAGILGEKNKFDQEKAIQDRLHQQQQDAENMRRWNTTDARAADLHPSAMDLQKAQAHWYHGRASAQDALANVRDGRQGPEAPSPLAGWGQDAEGNLLPPRGPAIPPANRPNGIVSAPDDVPADIAPAAMPPGGAGRFSPGFTQVADKRSQDMQSVAKYADEAAQQRLVDAMARRRALEATYGKPPSGKAWNDQGGLVDLSVKDTATERAMRMHASAGLNTLKTAEGLLEKTGTLDQLAGTEVSVPGIGKVGGFGEAGRGFRAARSAVLQLNFALSGKSVSNAEREEFQSIYMPSPFDSRETQRFKIKQVREFFNTVLNARKNGMDDDKIAELYRQSIAEGTKGTPAADPAQPRGPVRVNSPQEAAALPPGTRFIGHDGQERVRQ